MPNEPLVHVIDDDDAVRNSIEFMLRTAAINVETYDSAVTFLKRLPEIRFGCIVTDVRMPEMSGLDLLRRMRELAVKMPVVIITGHGDVPLAVEAMKTGAVDFIEKPFDDEVLLGAIRSALDVQQTDSRRAAEKADIHERIASLSTRERQVLEGLVAGLPNKTIAYDLGISPRTVEIYRANVMTKTKASSLSELVRIALVGGVLDNPVEPRA
jgi:two-component system, LuxR family, response regulator FixJ